MVLKLIRQQNVATAAASMITNSGAKITQGNYYKTARAKEATLRVKKKATFR